MYETADHRAARRRIVRRCSGAGTGVDSAHPRTCRCGSDWTSCQTRHRLGGRYRQSPTFDGQSGPTPTGRTKSPTSQRTDTRFICFRIPRTSLHKLRSASPAPRDTACSSSAEGEQLVWNGFFSPSRRGHYGHHHLTRRAIRLPERPRDGAARTVWTVRANSYISA